MVAINKVIANDTTVTTILLVKYRAKFARLFTVSKPIKLKVSALGILNGYLNIAFRFLNAFTKII